MIVILSVLLGAIFGWLKARKRGGTRLDQAQYIATSALISGIIGVLLTVILMRMVG